MALSRQLQGWLHSDDDFAGVTGPKTFNGGSSGGIAGDDNGLDPRGMNAAMQLAVNSRTSSVDRSP